MFSRFCSESNHNFTFTSESHSLSAKGKKKRFRATLHSILLGETFSYFQEIQASMLTRDINIILSRI